MFEQKYEHLTVGRLKWLLDRISDDATVIVACDECGNVWATGSEITFFNQGELQIGACGYNELKGVS